MLKLNSIPKNIFDATDVSSAQKVTVNSISGQKSVSRKEIVSAGRLVACEYIGNIINTNKFKLEKYNSKLEGTACDYASLAKGFKEKKLLFCAALADKQNGISDFITDFEVFKKNAMRYATDSTFLKANAAIDREVLEPIFFAVMDSVGSGLMQLESVPLGSTKEITVASNDVFVWEDSSFGSVRSTSKNYLYDNVVTLNPRAIACNATIKFYQDLVNGDAGRYYASIIRGYYSKIYAMEIAALKAVVGTQNNPYIPAGLTAATYTTANWIRISDLVAAANGVRVQDLMAVGTRSVLNVVTPVDGVGGAILGMSYGLGEEWFKNGYLGNVGGVDLFPVSPSIVPGTQNSSLDTIDTGNNIYILAKGGYRPIMGAYAEGSPFMLSANPYGAEGSAQGTADMTIDINVSAYIDIKAVFGSKVGVITAIS